jgi:hypothetical protein
MGASDKEITIDVLVCLDKTLHTHGKFAWNSIANFARGKAIHAYYRSMNSVWAQKRSAPDVNFRYFF